MDLTIFILTLQSLKCTIQVMIGCDQTFVVVHLREIYLSLHQ